MGAKKRLVYADALIDHFEWLQSEIGGERAADLGDYIQRIKDATTVDAVEVVRCKDCKHYDNREGIGWCNLNSDFYTDGLLDWHLFPEDGFCSYGERKDNVKRNEN